MEIVGHEIGRCTIGRDEFIFSVVTGWILNATDLIVDGLPCEGLPEGGLITRIPVIVPTWELEDIAPPFPLKGMDATFPLRDDDRVSALICTCRTNGHQELVYVQNHSAGYDKQLPDALEKLLRDFKLLRLPFPLTASVVAVLILAPFFLSFRLLPLWLAFPAFWFIKRSRKQPRLDTLRRFTHTMVENVVNAPPPQEV